MEYTLQIHFSVYAFIGLGNGETYIGKMIEWNYEPTHPLNTIILGSLMTQPY